MRDLAVHSPPTKLLPLAEILREAYPDVLQPWYADDAAMQGPPDQVAAA